MEGSKELCNDSPFELKSGDCLVYSFGVNNKELSFEVAMANKGCQVYIFDPAYSGDNNDYNDDGNNGGRSLYNLHENIHTYPYRIGKDNKKQMRSTNALHEWKRMSSIIDDIHHGKPGFKVDYLKLNVAGDELNFLHEMTTKRSRILRRYWKWVMIVHG